MRRSLSLLMGIVFVVSFLGCGHGFQANDEGNEVWLPWPMADFEFEVRPVKIETLPSPKSASGPAAKVYVSSGGNSAGFKGPVAEPRLARVGKRWLPKDVPSSEALVAYAIFERLLKFDTSLGVANLLRWPRQVGVQINLKSSTGAIFSNAVYDVESDSIVIARLQYNGAPLSINHGVVAHEHFHAHFARAFKSVATSNDPKGENFRLNNIVLNTINEGLADFYATVFTGDTNFAERSFGEKGKARDLNGPLGQFSVWLSQIGNVKDERVIVYGNGTLLARALLQWGQPPQKVLNEVLRTLPVVVGELIEKSKDHPLDPSDFYVSLLAHQNLPLSAEWCGKIQSQSSGRLSAASLRGCP